ncbi:MAG: YiiX/YebB-like N1pC/P60 family cysteine hydrolase [Bacteroidota bacterium]
MNRIHFLLICFCLRIIAVNGQEEQFFKSGDLLFQDLNCGELCDAIEAVTYGVQGRDFSHCGMIVEWNDSLMVLEAIGTAVQINSIEHFLERSGDVMHIRNSVLGRVKEEYLEVTKKAVRRALSMIGEPYDPEFLIDNGKWYCSELIYECFLDANNEEPFFDLAPMTFKDPMSKIFFPAWIEYYKELNESIPEGEPGINPGSLSRSDKLEIIDLENLKK